MKCPACSTDNTAGMKFCGECGASLSGRASAQLAPSSGGSIPASVLPGLTADRRLVTILFADISGFTALSEKLDPEAVRDLITACFDRLVPCIERYGGTIDKFMGDEVMALFGAPVAHENDPERALRAALEMRDALLDFDREHGVSLGLHFGINTGLVYAGGVGGGSRQDYSVMGDAVNVASRLKGAATSGEILVGAETYRQAAYLFEFQTAEALRFKGKTEPLTAYRLLDAHAGPDSSSDRRSRGLSSPLVGRQAELAVFQDRLALLHAGQGGVAILTAEAGLGKSRLVAEARSRAETDGLSWLEGRTLSFGRTISYWPLLEIIQQDAGIDSSESEAGRWAKLSTRLTGLFEQQAAEILPYLGTLLNVSLPDDVAAKVRYLDGEAMGHQIYRATRLYFGRLAQERPIVVVFEDVHWLDGSSAALLEHLLPLTKESPILFWFVSRPEAESVLTRLQELSRGGYSERLTEIRLEPLSAEESTRLACNLVNLDDLPPRLKESITVKAEGNPFYVEEVMRSLVDQSGLVLDPATGRYRVTDQATHVLIPGTLRGVIMTRIDRLDEDLKVVLRLASVVGRSFFYRVLAAIDEAEQELDQSLAGLEARELIRETARTPELEYIFKHALVQEATYESILLQQRKELHRRVALAIETLFPDRLEEFYSLLAFHYSRAEDWDKAQDYLFKAGDQAGSIAADAEALAHYEEAVEAYSKVFGDRWDPLQRAALERRMGEALYRIGEHERAHEYFYSALTTLGRPYPTSESGLRRAVAGQLLVQLGHRLSWWLPRRPRSPHASTLAWERAWVYFYLAGMDFTYPLQMVCETLLALNALEGDSEPGGFGGWCAAAGYACDLIPLPGLSRYYHEKCARALEGEHRDSIELQSFLAQTHVLLGMHEHLATGDWPRALDLLRYARERLFRVGNIRYWAAATDQLSHLLRDQGEFKEAQNLSEEVARFGGEAGDRVAEAWGRMDVGEVLFAQGALDRAEANLRPAAEELRASLDVANSAKAAACIAHCYMKQGRAEEARTILAEESALVRKHGIRGYYIRNVWTGNAAWCLIAAEEAAGVDRIGALRDAEGACRELLKHGKIDIPALVPAYRMQGTYEWLRGRPNKAAEWWSKSLEHAEKLGARYEEALTRLEMGRRLGDRTHLEAAEAALAEMGAAWDLAEARRLLGRADIVEQAVIA